MVSVIRGNIANIAMSEILTEYFEKHDEMYGNLFLGYPILPTREDKLSIDALFVSPVYGIVIFHFYEGREEIDLEEIQDEIYGLLLSKLAKEKKLVKRQIVNLDLNIISFTPNWKRQYRFDDDGFNAFNSLSQVDNFLIENDFKENAQYYELAIRCIQSIGTIKKVLTREKVVKTDSRGAILRELESKIANLDKIQTAAALEVCDDVQRIRGLAGSGKTIVLALKAAYLHVAHPDWKIAVTFNTRSLKQQFKDLITRFTFEQIEDTPNWNNIQVLHAWGSPYELGLYYNFCKLHGVEYLDFTDAKSKSNYSTAFDYAIYQALQNVNSFHQMYDAILVDEAQDFSGGFLNLCYEILPDKKRLIYAYDELQSLNLKKMDSPEVIFGKNVEGAPRVVLKNSKNKPKQDIILRTCYRNSRPVLASAHALGFRVYGDLIQMFDESALWLDIGYEVKQGELADNKPVVLQRTEESSPKFLEDHSSIDDLLVFKAFENSETQAKWVARQIKKNLEDDELDYKDILVIHTDPLKTKKDVGVVRKELARLDINSHLVGVTTSPDDFYMSNSIAFTSIFRAKGNEAAIVYVIDSQYCGGNYSTARSRNILFTAMTRSRAWVRVVGVGRQMIDLNREYNTIKDHNFELAFIYPDAAKRKELNIIHRDKTKDELLQIEKNVSNLQQIIISLEKGDMYWEDIPEEFKSKLKEMLGDE